jgi:hypothetical protein
MAKIKIKRKPPSKIIDCGTHLEVVLTKGQRALIDREDLPLVQGRFWYVKGDPDRTHYAMTTVRTKAGWEALSMHRLLLNVLPGFQVDHRNGNGLDNRRFNIRIATVVDNARNTRIHRDNKVGFKGVHFDKRNGKFRAHIGLNGRSRYIGSYKTAENAAKAYDEAAIEYFGEFARLNFPPRGFESCLEER